MLLAAHRQSFLRMVGRWTSRRSSNGRSGWATCSSEPSRRCGGGWTANWHQHLSAAGYAVLAASEAQPGLSNAGLARRSFVTRQTMVQIVVGLEEAGLLRRRAHPGRGRALPAELTAKGHRRLQAAHRAVEVIEAEMVASLDGSERSQLADLLRRVASALAEEGPPTGTTRLRAPA